MFSYGTHGVPGKYKKFIACYKVNGTHFSLYMFCRADCCSNVWSMFPWHHFLLQWPHTYFCWTLLVSSLKLIHITLVQQQNYGLSITHPTAHDKSELSVMVINLDTHQGDVGLDSMLQCKGPFLKIFHHWITSQTHPSYQEL